MILVRNCMTANIGRRDELVGFLKEMHAAMQKDLGAPDGRVLTGSIGPSDQIVVLESEYESLAQFEAELAKMNGWARMAELFPRYAELVVAGSSSIEVYRIQG